jgi:hypothetical protein
MMGEDFRELRLLDAAPRFLERFREAANRVLERFKKTGMRSAMARFILAFAQGVAYAVIIFVFAPQAFANPALLSRAQGGMGADTAIRLAQGSTRDMLSGTLKELEGSASRRGVGGTGAEGIQKSAATTKAQQQMAGQSSQIAYGAEQDRNKLYEDIAGIAGNSDQLQNEQRRTGLSQWQAQQNVNLEQQRINQAKDDRLLSILTQALF